MVSAKFLLLATICILLVALPISAGEKILDKVAITKVEFFQKGKLIEVAKDDDPLRIRAYLGAKEIAPEFRDKFLLIFYLDDLPIRTLPISDILYTPFVDYLWEKPTSGLHSISASLSTADAIGKMVHYKIFIEEVKPVLRINSLEIDTTRRLEAGDRVKFFILVSNDSEKVILPNDFIIRVELKAKEEERTILLDFGTSPRIDAKAHNVSLGPIEWLVEDGNWLVYPQILPRMVNNKKVLEVVKAEATFLDLRIGESRPDLFLTLSLSPHSPYTGESVKISVDVENRGDLPCEKYRLFLYVDGRRQGSIIEGPTILPEKSKNFHFAWTAEGGTHYLKVAASYEFDERKFLTKAESPLTVETGINLVPVILSWKPADPQSGDIMSILTRIENIGLSPIHPWHEETEVGYKAIFSVDGMDKEVKFDVEIGPGEKGDFEFNWEAEEGEHVLGFSCSYFGAKDTEPLLWRDEEAIKVSPPPKLVCVGDNWSPNPPTKGDIVAVSLFVKNDGEGLARLWDEEEMTGYKIVFSIGSEGKEVSKRIPPGKEVTFSFHYKLAEAGEYPVEVSFVNPSGREIVKPYKGTLSVLSLEPIDELEKDTLKVLEKKGKNRASLYKSLGKDLEELLHPPHSKLKKLARKASKIVLATSKSILEERQALPFPGKSLEDRDLAEMGRNIEEIVDDIDRIDWSSALPEEGKMKSEYANLREYIFRSFFSEAGIVYFLEKETAGYRQIIANNLAFSEEKIRPYPDAKNDLLSVLKGKEKLGMDIYQDFQKKESPFAFLRKEAEREKRGKIQLRLLEFIISMLRSEGLMAGDLQGEFYRR